METVSAKKAEWKTRVNKDLAYGGEEHVCPKKVNLACKYWYRNAITNRAKRERI